MSKFKVGDIIKAIDNYYGVTNKKLNYIGKVIGFARGGLIEIEEVSSDFKLPQGCTWTLHEDHFELVTPRKQEIETHPLAKKYIEQEGVTVVIWQDGTKTVVRCQEEPDREKALAICCAKKMFGGYKQFTDAFDIVDKKQKDMSDIDPRVTIVMNEHGIELGEEIFACGQRNKLTKTGYSYIIISPWIEGRIGSYVWDEIAKGNFTRGKTK